MIEYYIILFIPLIKPWIVNAMETSRQITLKLRREMDGWMEAVNLVIGVIAIVSTNTYSTVVSYF